MAVVGLLDEAQAPLTAKRYFADGDPGPIVASLAHVPELLEAAMPFLGTVFGPSALSFRTKEIIVLRTSRLQSCRYCTETHTVVAREAGLSIDEVRALRDEGAPEAIDDPAEVALVGWVDAVAGSLQAPSNDVEEAVRRHFSDSEVIEATMLIGATMMLTRYATSLQLPTSEDTLQRLREEGFPTGGDLQ